MSTTRAGSSRSATLRIDPSWNAWQLARALDRPSLGRSCATSLRRPALHATPQDDSAATLAPSPTDEELEIDWTWTSERIARRIRAASPSPGAWSFFGDEPVTITRAAPAPDASLGRSSPERRPSWTGEAVVRTGDGALTLLEGRMDAAEDEEPYELDASDLAALISELQGELQEEAVKPPQPDNA